MSDGTPKLPQATVMKFASLGWPGSRIKGSKYYRGYCSCGEPIRVPTRAHAIAGACMCHDCALASSEGPSQRLGIGRSGALTSGTSDKP